ncbi:hypothetical protein P3G55_00075 [Leptospira sp. 96542]|nr:hypothetical protein [Leptospira sp. 96542]
MSLPTTNVHEPMRYWNRRDLSLLTGDRGMYKLAIGWQFALANSGFKIFNLDCAIRFNPFIITSETRKNNLMPEPILEQILIQRAFTPYQILDSLQTILHSNEKNTIYFLLSPTKQFLDADVKEDEGLYLLHKMLNILKEYPKYNRPLLIVESWTYKHKNFQIFFPKLLRMAENLWELQVENGLSQIKTRKRSLLR